MKKIAIVMIFLVTGSVLFSQVPEGINYQAVARDEAGQVLRNNDMTVRLGIRQGGAEGVLLWQEDHEVTTNDFGLFNVVIGDTSAVHTGGTLSSFRDIDWSAGNLYLETSLGLTDDGTFMAMGMTPILAVPIAYYARSVGSLHNLEIRAPGGGSPDSALFIVRRADGQTVFAVYNDSVVVYVNDAVKKGPRGGFIIGGFGPDKGSGRDYLRVTPDSVRVYIDDSRTKGPRGGFAIGGFGINKGPANQYFNVSGEGSVRVINPGEPRILWYPRKEAFLAGRVLIESPDSVGLNSLSMGYETKAIGQWSTALGFKSVAASDYSLSIGLQTRAAGFNSFALGFQSQALNEGSFAFGTKVVASGLGSFAFGAPGIDESGNVQSNLTEARGDFSLAFGLGTHSNGMGSLALGANNSAEGPFSVALGNATLAQGGNAVALGGMTVAGGGSSMAVGDRSVAQGYAAVAMGENAQAKKNYSFAVGFNSIADGESAIALGNTSLASGDFSLAAGLNSKALGKQSVAFGGDAQADLSMALGAGTVANSFGALVLGRYNDPGYIDGKPPISLVDWQDSDPVFVVGNGNDDQHRNNALILYKNGDLIISGNMEAMEYNTPSDLRLKKDISPLGEVTGKLQYIHPVYFKYKDIRYDPVRRRIGFIAQDVEKMFPELVNKDNKGYLSIDYSKMSAVLLQAIKEQQQTIVELQKKIAAMEQEKSEIAQLKRELDELRKSLSLGNRGLEK